jgi:starvation-inducible DNA-binding protein
MARTSTKNSSTQMVEHLIDVLGDTYVLMVKTHGFHWNVTGALFPQLHAQFGAQYEALFEAADEVAERIRALDMPAPGSMSAFLDNTTLKEASGHPLTASAMVKDLLKSHEQVRARVAEACDFAGELGDKATEDLMIKRLEEHDKTIWMLRAQVG